jgi:tetratricopeptide (TPR) repeat protein
MFRVIAPRSLVAILVVGVAISLVGCGGAEYRFTSHMDRGKQFLAQGNLEKASVEFRNALQIRPKASEALYLNAQVAERRGDMRAAVGLYQATVEADPDQVKARASLGSIYVVGGLPDKALELVEPYLAKHPDVPGLLVVRGAARLTKKNQDGARADAEHALKLDPDNERAVGLLAGIDRSSGDIAGATALVEDAVRRLPASVELREVLTGLYFDSDKQEQAQEQLKKLVELRPRETRYRFELAMALSQSHQIDAAQRVLEDAVKEAPDNDSAKLTLVDFVWSQRSPAEAEKLLKDFVDRNPHDYDLRLGLGALYQRGNSLQNALGTYAEVVKLDGVHPHGLLARNRIAAVEMAQGHFAEAQKLIAEVLKENPRDDDALAMRGTIEAQQNDSKAAIADLRAAIRDQPTAIDLRRTLARAYLAGGQSGLAEQTLREALEIAPKEVRVRVELAEVLVRNNNIDQAVSTLEEAVRDAPSDLPAREGLVRAYLAKRDLAAAHKAIDDLQTLRPDAASGFYLAGLVAQEEQRLDDSDKAFEHALTLQPNAIDVLLAISHLEVGRGQGDKAITRLQALMTKEPKNALAENLLGEVYEATKDYPHALEAFARTTTLAPNWAVPYRDLARLKAAQNDNVGAISAYQAGLKAIPNDASMALELAAIYERQGRIDDSIALLDTLNRSNPDLQVVANNLAMLLATYRTDRSDLDRARDLTASFVNSNDAILLDTHGWVRFKRGEYAEALPVLERALERKPDSGVIRYHAAMAELHAGQRERARDNLQSALGGTGQFVGSDQARAVLASLKDSTG